MPEFAPARLVQWTGGTWAGTPPGQITGFSYDTRLLEKGECFVALETEKRDGHQFLAEAEERGASMALVAHPVGSSGLPQLVVNDPLAGLQEIARGHRETLGIPVIGITGSCGKTSTKDLLRLLLGEAETLATEGNLNNTLGLPITLLRADPRLHRRAVIEAGINRRGEMGVLANVLRPDVAIVTMVGPAHLEFLKSMEGVAREKSLLLRGERSRGRNYFADSCLEWKPFRDLRSFSTVIRSTSSRRNGGESGDFYEYALDNQPGGGRALAVRTRTGPVLLFPVPHMSPGQAQNAALAVAVALDLGEKPDQIRNRFQGWKPSPHRGEKLKQGNQFFYADCYNSNPASVTDTLAAFEEAFSPELPRLYVLGSMDELGEEAEKFHRQVGSQIFLRSGDVALFIGRFAGAMLDGLKRNSPPPGSFQTFPATGDARAGVEYFSGAILLKGSRSYQLEQLLPVGVTPIREEAQPC